MKTYIKLCSIIFIIAVLLPGCSGTIPSPSAAIKAQNALGTLPSSSAPAALETLSPETPFPFTQENIDAAVAEKLLWYKEGLEWDWHSSRSGNALYYLTVACTYDPEYPAADGTKIKDRVAAHFRHVMSDGYTDGRTNEPGCSGGLNAMGYNPFFQSLAIAMTLPAIWDQFTPIEQNKLVLISKAALVGAHWCYDDDNDFSTGIDQQGNFGKEWNPNYREGGVGTAIACTYILGGAGASDSFLVTFDYDSFMKELKDNNLLNIAYVFDQTGKQALEAATRDTFTYHGHPTEEKFQWVQDLADRMYSAAVSPHGSSWDDGQNSYLGKLQWGEAELPNEGQPGMGTEFDSTDGNGPRSSAMYVFLGWQNSIINKHTVDYFGDFGQGEAQTIVEKKMAVGSADLIYKLQIGYNDWAKGSWQGLTDEEGVEAVGKYFLLKELWLNVIHPQVPAE